MEPQGAEQKVVATLEVRNLRCEPFSKMEKKAGKTTDRRVYQGDDLSLGGYIEKLCGTAAGDDPAILCAAIPHGTFKQTISRFFSYHF